MYRRARSLSTPLTSHSPTPKRFLSFIEKSNTFYSTITQSQTQESTQTFHQNSPLKPRLESHFKNNLISEISILLIENQVRKRLGLGLGLEGMERDTTGDTTETYLNSMEKGIRDFRSDYILNSTNNFNPFDAFLNELPTSPNSATSPQTKWIIPSSTKSVNQLQRQRRNLPNPIDYTSIPSTLLHAKPDTPPPPPFSPLPSRMPSLHSISLSITTDEAIGNKPVLLSAIMALQCVSGKRADPVFATKGDASKKIRAGMPIGAKASARPTRYYLQSAYHALH